MIMRCTTIRRIRLSALQCMIYLVLASFLFIKVYTHKVNILCSCKMLEMNHNVRRTDMSFGEFDDFVFV